jgi:hypothetical protein
LPKKQKKKKDGRQQRTTATAMAHQPSATINLQSPVANGSGLWVAWYLVVDS